MDLSHVKVAALATTGFEEVEFTEPRKALREAGATVHLVSPESGRIKSWDVDDWGRRFRVDARLEDVTAENYDALLLPGGVLNPDKLRTNGEALFFIASFLKANKPVAVICHGSQTMISAGLVRGRTMTAYKSIRTDLVNAGAKFVDQAVVVDGNLISSRNPEDLAAFNEKIVEVFARVPAPAN